MQLKAVYAQNYFEGPADVSCFTELCAEMGMHTFLVLEVFCINGISTGNYHTSLTHRIDENILIIKPHAA